MYLTDKKLSAPGFPIPMDIPYPETPYIPGALFYFSKYPLIIPLLSIRMKPLYGEYRYRKDFKCVKKPKKT
jgi:hypothetical protein